MKIVATHCNEYNSFLFQNRNFFAKLFLAHNVPSFTLNRHAKNQDYIITHSMVKPMLKLYSPIGLYWERKKSDFGPLCQKKRHFLAPNVAKNSKSLIFCSVSQRFAQKSRWKVCAIADVVGHWCPKQSSPRLFSLGYQLRHKMTS